MKRKLTGFFVFQSLNLAVLRHRTRSGNAGSLTIRKRSETRARSWPPASVCDCCLALCFFDAGIAQLVERNLAKVKVTSSTLVSRSISKCSSRLPAVGGSHDLPLRKIVECLEIERRDLFVAR